MSITAKELVSNVSDKISLPDTVVRVNYMVGHPGFSAADIGDTISSDQDLSARLLRIANSRFFNFPSHIDNVHRAVTVIGNRELRDLLLATSAIDVFDKLPNDLVSIETFWRHSLRCAVISRTLAKQLHKANVERYFTAGLLHDIGSLLINYQLPEQAKEILAQSNHHRQRRFLIEQEILGFSHADVGAELLRLWGLPDYIISSVEYHHTPSLTNRFQQDVAIAHIANYLSNTMLTNIGENPDASVGLDLSTLQTANLSPEELQSVLKRSDQQFDDTLEIMVYDEVA